MEKIKKGETLGLYVQTRKKPKKDAPKYEFKTISDIFNFLTPKNHKRFLKEFSMGMVAAMNLREVIRVTAQAQLKEKGIEMTLENKDLMAMPSFTWVDD